MKAVQKQTKSLGGWVKKNSGQFKAMGVAIAAMGAAALLTFKKMVKQYVETGDMIHKMAIRTGFAAETLSELAYAADISGADINMLEKGVKKMSKTIVDASYGLETYLRVFRGLGIEIEDIMKLSPEEQFLTLGAAISKMENQTLKTAAAVDIFGRAGTMLLPFFAEGAEGMAKLREEAHKLGIIFDEEAAAKAAALKDAQTALTGSVKGLSIAILTDLIPVLTDVTKEFTDWFVENRKHAGTWATVLISFFELVAKGAMKLLAGFQILQSAVFEMAAGITTAFREYIEKLIIGFGLLAQVGVPVKNLLKDLMQAWVDLKAVEKGYIDQMDIHIEQAADVIVGFQKFFELLEKIKIKTEEATIAQRNFGIAIAETALPAARDMTGVLEGIQGQLTQTGAAFVTGGKMTEGAMAKQEAALMSVASAYQGGLPGIMSAIKMVTIGEFLKSLATSAMPFLAKLAIAGVVVGMISAIFAGFMKAVSPKGFATGGRIGKGEPGIIGERGEELFVPDTAGAIIPLRERMPSAVAGAIININTELNISAIDGISTRDFMREQGLEAIVEAIKLGIKKPELQDALGIK